jgi:formyl-CoA transferase
MNKSAKPLDGIRVLDLTRYLAGPYCTLLLAGLGAEVIKIEPPGHGDIYRGRAPFAGPQGCHMDRQTPDDIGIGLLHRSRNKKSITLNLREEAGRDVFKSLCRNVDVVVENYSPGVMDKMGLGFDALAALNPRLILSSISGFGHTGPLKHWRAYDPIVQGMSGLMAITGYKGNPPVRSGAAVADTVAPLVAVIGILAAITRRAHTGVGDWVDVAMLDSLAFIMPEVMEFFQGGALTFPLENRHPGGVPFNMFETTDGHVYIATVTDNDWQALLKAMGREDLAGDPRFMRLADRRRNRDELEAVVVEWVGGQARDQVVETLQRNKVACGAVMDIDEVLNSEQLKARGMLVDVDMPDGGQVLNVRGLGVPIQFTNAEAGFDRPAPLLGEHNEEVLTEFAGLSAEQIEELKSNGVI